MASVDNHLIELLPPAVRLRVQAACEPVQLELAQILSEPGDATRHVYFPVNGFISLVAQVEGKPGVEVGMVGREGMLGAHLALGITRAPLHALVQGAGSAWRMSAAAFRRELKHSPPMQQALNRYLYVLMAQQSTAAACLRFHLTGQRLARWLLMSQDRAHSSQFHVTHEFLAYMLGMRRVGITTAAKALQRDGLIGYHRGEVTVLDRKGLETAACSCYATDRRTYSEQLH